MRLSILNFFSSPHEAIGLAELCDELGYHRFWVGEHHSANQIPDALGFAAIAAGATERIRVGTGAVSLVFRNPHMIAESAISAQVFFPDRIDLGVTKAAAVNPALAAQLLDGCDAQRIVDRYDERLRTLRDILTRESSATDLFLRDAVPLGPPMYVMATSDDRARSTGEMGLGLVASFHHGATVDGVHGMIDAYRERFTPSPLFEAPCAIAVVSGLVSDDPETVAAAVVGEQVLRQQSAGLFARTISVFAGGDEGATRLGQLGTSVAADEVMFLCVSRRCAECYRALASSWARTTASR